MVERSSRVAAAKRNGDQDQGGERVLHPAGEGQEVAELEDVVAVEGRGAALGQPGRGLEAEEERQIDEGAEQHRRQQDLQRQRDAPAKNGRRGW